MDSDIDQIRSDQITEHDSTHVASSWLV